MKLAPKQILLALLGCVLAITACWIFGQARYAQLLKLQTPQEQIRAAADTELKHSPLADYNLRLKRGTRFNEDLFRFAQKYLANRTEKIVGRINRLQFDWNDEIDIDKKSREIQLRLEYDGRGRLTGFQKRFLALADSANLELSEALRRAKKFLVSQNVDTARLTLTEKNSKIEDHVQSYDIKFEQTSSISDSLKQVYTINFSGSDITGFGKELLLDEEKFQFPEFENTFDIVMAVGIAVVWTGMIILLIVVLFKRLRHDEVDFKGGRWLGLVTGVFLFGNVALKTWPEWESIVFGGVVGGLFMGIGALLCFATTESLNRGIWPEKITLFEHFIRGRMRFKEMGSAILRALFMAGAAIFFTSLLAWGMGKLAIGYISLEEDRLWVFADNFSAAGTLLGNITQAIFVTLLLLSFWPAYLRTKTAKGFWIMAFTALLLLLAGLDHIFIAPAYFAFFLFLPVAVLFARAAYQFDLMTVFLTILCAYVFLDFNLIAIQPDGILGFAGIIGLLFIIGLLVTGVILVYSKRSLADVKEYVPEYVSRIAERERLKKELEIARSIQFQFLPGKVPSFPGLDIASICKPAMEVGGDYYDFMQNGYDSLSVVIGDVSGKGVSAAFYMTMTKGIIKTLSKWIKEPSKLLAELNEVFYANTPRNVFISVLYGIFDMKNNTLTFSRAGHNPLMVRKSKAAEMEILNPRGIAIGMDKGRLFEKIIKEETVTIETGDVFIFYTDGISEAMNGRGEEFGEERLAETLAKYAHLSAQDILDHINKSVFDFAGNTPQHDDFTMVVVKVGTNGL